MNEWMNDFFGRPKALTFYTILFEKKNIELGMFHLFKECQSRDRDKRAGNSNLLRNY